jgi:Fe2+ transport system protein FeoA
MGHVDSSDRDGRVSLADLEPGDRVRIVGFEMVATHRIRLLEMGLTAGSEVEVIRFAPLGDPIDVKVRGYHLSLRRNEASGILVARL